MITGNITIKSENSEYGIETNADSVAMDANNNQKNAFNAKPYIISSGVKSYLSGLSSDIPFYFEYQAYDKSDNEVALQNTNKKYGTSGADVVSESPYNVTIEDSEPSGKVSYLKLILSVNNSIVYTKIIYLNRDLPIAFSRSDVWSSGLTFNNGNLIISDNVVYQWNYPHAGNSAVNPTTDITNNPTTTHWVAYQQWTLLATKIIMAAFALLGGAVFSGDYMYSQQGKDASGNDTSNYNLFDASKLGTASCPFTPSIYINYKIGEIHASKGVFSGTLDSVSGSFLELICKGNLQCINNNGDTVFNIGASNFYIQGIDMQHQGVYNGRTLRALMSNIRCRGAFGAESLNFMTVNNNVIRYYVNGNFYFDNNTADYIEGTANISSYNGQNYYDLHLYPDSSSINNKTEHGLAKISDLNGFPVDVIIIVSTNSANYRLLSQPQKQVTIINANDGNNSIWFASCENAAHQLQGGNIMDLINVDPSFMSGSRILNSIDKSCWMIRSRYNNDFN